MKLYILFLLVVISVPTVVSTDLCTSITDILTNKESCDNQTITLTGWVQNRQYSVEYNITRFDITDGFNIIKAVGAGEVPIYDGISVAVEGVFYKKIEGDPPIYDVLIVFSDGIFVQTNHQEIPIFIIVAFLVIVALFIIGVYLYFNRKNMEGKTFEKYIADMFSPTEWSIVDYTKDRSLGRWIESSKNPDIVVRHKKSGRQFAIECKFRSAFLKGKKGEFGLEWARKDQIETYNRFSQNKSIPVFVCIGVGNTPKTPTRIFLLNLENLKYPWAFKNYLEKFEINTKSIFILGQNGNITSKTNE